MKPFKILPFLILPMLAFQAYAQEPAQNEPQKKQSQAAAKFLPDIYLNADFSGVYRNLGQGKFDSLEIPGFGESGFYAETLNPLKGFNFNYAELGMYSAVDPFFDFSATFHLTVDSFEIEEAYARTLSLPANFQLKLGKFLSSFGRLNEVHAHAWDFSDQPLVNHAFFGPENLNEMGARLTWLLPLPFYLLIGAEVLTGNNDVSFGPDGFSDPAEINTISDGTYPDTYTAYIKSSFDIDDLVILLGVSGARGTIRADHGISDVDGFGVSGDSSLLGADITLKFLMDTTKYIAWQTEYIYRNIDGNMYTNAGTSETYYANQSGLYSQLVFQFYKGWKAGVRFDLLQKNKIYVGGADQDHPENLTRYSAMVEYSPSEFSRFRLQYNYDRSGYDGADMNENHQVAINANFNIGSHSAHSF
jgi:hypothetical protein